MKNTHKAKIIASKLAKKAEREAQRIVVDDHWRIVRADEFNWVIEQQVTTEAGTKWKNMGYYAEMAHALRALPHKILSAEAKNSLAEVWGSLRGISERVERAIVRMRELASGGVQ